MASCTQEQLIVKEHESQVLMQVLPSSDSTQNLIQLQQQSGGSSIAIGHSKSFLAVSSI